MTNLPHGRFVFKTEILEDGDEKLMLSPICSGLGSTALKKSDNLNRRRRSDHYKKVLPFLLFEFLILLKKSLPFYYFFG
jgi:hypothetical protein